MGDDVTNIIVTEPTTEEETVEEIGEELLSRLDELDAKLGELYARITELERRQTELESREFSPIEHGHEGFAATEHSHEHEHEGYALTEHEHQGSQAPREPDIPPKKQHPYFRKLDEF